MIGLDYDTPEAMEKALKKEGFKTVDEFRALYDKNPNNPRVKRITNGKLKGTATNYTFEANQKIAYPDGTSKIGGKGTILGDEAQYKYLNNIKDSNNVGSKGHGITITDTNKRSVETRTLTDGSGKQRRNIDCHAGGSGASAGCVTKTTLKNSRINSAKVSDEIKAIAPSLNDKGEQTYIYLPPKKDEYK